MALLQKFQAFFRTRNLDPLSRPSVGNLSKRILEKAINVHAPPLRSVRLIFKGVSKKASLLAKQNES